VLSPNRRDSIASHRAAALPPASRAQSSRARHLPVGFAVAALVSSALAVADAQQQAVTVGPNVNVISGTGEGGDWTAQRQNEPTIACSSRNPENCLAGGNDYRSVDLPFPNAGERITGDAWLGWYTTKDGGLTWRTRLLPGFPQDRSADGLSSPLHGYGAGADPIIRSGSNGLFYYGGLVFDRDEAGGSAIFVARFIDNNNQEGIDGEPIAYLGATIVHRLGAVPTPMARRRMEGESRVASNAPATARGTQDQRWRTAGVESQGIPTQLVDKPWMAVDIPRAGAQTCSIGGPGTGVPLQTFPGGRVYMVYTLFDGTDEQRGRILFSRSSDCGATWSTPRVISRVPSPDVNDDGVATTADLTRLQASFGRSCGHPAYNPNADINNDCIVNVLDLAFVSRGVGRPVPPQPRLSQGSTVAIDPRNGALQIAWRQFTDGVLPNAIVTVRSADGGTAFSAPTTVAAINPFDQGTTDTSFRTNAFPTMSFDGSGRAYLAWSARGFAIQRPDPAAGDGRIVLSSSTNGTTWSVPAAIDDQGEPGHQIMPGLTFAQGKLHLVYYDLRDDVSRLFGPFVDELPILAGPAPRVRHTIDVRAAVADPAAAPLFSSFSLSQYQTGSLPGSTEVGQLQFSPPNLPLFRAGTSPFMGDYLDTAPAVPIVPNGSGWTFNTAPSSGSVFHAIWTDNRDVRPPADGDWSNYTAPNPPFARPAMSGFDPTQTLPACVPGQAGMRNQNLYTARITTGLVVGALSNSRSLDTIQRSFPVYAQNNSPVVRSYRLTIDNQPVGGSASFRQFDLLTTLDVSVAPRSTVARTVFAQSSDAHARITLSVVEIAAPGGAPVANGQQGTIILNPDPTNPRIENPRIENPRIENPDVENAEVYNPDVENATVGNPRIENPRIENPRIENSDIENVIVANPDILNPDVANPDIENPRIENPRIENPNIASTDLVNGSLSDTTWTVTNGGNAAAAFTIRLALNQQLPAGFKSQLIAHKVYTTPTVLGCSLLTEPQTVLLANVPNPTFVSASELANPDVENPRIENVTVALLPGETARITLRVLDPNRFDAVTFSPADSVAPAAVAQSVNTEDAANGETQPPAAGVLTSDEPVPGSTVGGTYSTTLSSVGAGTWTLVSGSLPPGLTLDSATGQLSGTPTQNGTFTFTLRFDADSGLTDYRAMTIVIGDVGASADLGLTVPPPAGPIPLGDDLVYTLNVSNAGPLAATNVMLRDTLPPGATFVSVTPTQGTCQQGNGTVNCALGSLASGASATVVLTVQPTVSGDQINEAQISADQPDPVVTNNTARTTGATLSIGCANPCFSGPTPFTAGPGDSSFQVEKGDFNEDGRIDLVFSPADDLAISVLFGDGTGGFSAPLLLTTLDVPQAIAVGDFNNDGHTDIVAGSGIGTRASVFLGDGSGGFSGPGLVNVGAPKFVVAASDLDLDGNLDLVFSGTNAASTQIALLPGNGDGSFGAPFNVTVGAGPHSLIVDDFNNDGTPDIASGNVNAGTLSILLGDGNGGFAVTTTAFPTISRVRKVGDLNGDGFSDLVIADAPSGPRRQQVFFGDGNGGFGSPVDLNVDPATLFTTSGDLDGDGDLDLISTQQQSGGIAVQLNDGTGAFGSAAVWSAPVGGSLVIGDFNGDQQPDIAFGASAPRRVVVLLNTCGQPAADLDLTPASIQPTAVEGEIISHALVAANLGPNPTSVQLTVSANTRLISVTPAQGGCVIDGSLATCQLGTLASGATVNVDVSALALGGGTAGVLAGLAAATSDPDPTNNSTLLTTAVTAVASTLVVTNTNTTGPGSLRDAITIANLDAGPADIITFDIPGAGVHTISPTPLTNLPNITQPVVIDATTQPGYAGTPLIEISGASAAANAYGLNISAGGSVIRGLAINRWGAGGIFVGGSGGNRFEANFIGTNAAGTVALPNGAPPPGFGHGMNVQSANNVIGGTTAAARNVISANTGTGVLLFGAGGTGNVISGNYIGTDVTGAVDLGNINDGVNVRSANNTIGGTAAGAGNVISGNNSDGVDLGAGATGNLVQGNRIGTNAAGTSALGNSFAAIFLANGANNNTVGGTVAVARNILSGNGTNGLFITDATTTLNTVIGNFIGTDVTGTASIGNVFDGVGFVNGTQGNTIGGAAAGAGNLISGNRIGVGAFGGFANAGNAVLGNKIGTDATGTQPLGNNGGIFLNTGGNIIGGVVAGAGNTIAFNSDIGVRVESGTGNAILSNSIFSNGALGIDLVALGVTPNDPVDADAGPNNLQNFPVLASAPGGVTGTLNSTANTTFRIEFFANDTCDPSGNGEGAAFLGAVSVTTDATGNAVIPFFAAVPGQFVTATATDPSNNTSEFAACVQPEAGDSGVYVVTTTADSGAGSLRQALLEANAHVNGAAPDLIRFDISGTGPFTIAPTSFLPTISDPVILDATTQPGFTGVPIVELDGAVAGAQASGLFISSGGTTIRGLAINRFGMQGQPGDPGGAGIVIQGAGGNVIERSFIGTDVTGTLPRPNRNDAVFIDNSPNNRIGGTVVAARNVLSGNSRWGIVLSGAGTTGTAVQGNVIGTDVTGVLPLPNGAGGLFVEGSGSTIGAAAGTNVVAFNGGPGVAVAAGTTHRIANNSIHSNAGLGIDLFNDGVTLNDAGDVDTGVNNLQNFPVLVALNDGGVDVSLNSAANTTFTIELYTSPSCHPLGFGEGRTLWGTLQLTTNGSGNATVAGVPVPDDVFVTATAIDPNGNTAEFSACVLTAGDNSPPIANAGPNQTVPLNATVQLDGSASSDPDNDPLTYLWILNTKPAGSNAVLAGSTTSSPTFVADVAGTYVLQLLVNDGFVNSASDLVSVSTQNNAPAANAGPDQINIPINGTVTLNGSGSQDPDGTPVTYAWTLILRPSGSAATLTSPTSVSPTFVADVAGRYRAQLIVSDGLLPSAADTVDITTVNQPPIANAGADRTVAAGATVILNGGGSSDPDNNPLTFTWTLFSRPPGSTAALSGASTATPSFVADVTGSYVVRLVVSDTIVDSAVDEVVVTATPNSIGLSLVGTSLVGVGQTATLRAMLPAPAPAGGVTIAVTSDDTNVVTIGPPGTVNILQGGTTGDVTLNGINAGTTTVRANATGYVEGTFSVTTTQNVLTVPATLNVPFGGTVSFPVNVPNPAPPGGLTIDLVSSVPANVEVLASTVTIPQGAVSANGSLRGAGIGSATVTASLASFSSASSTVSSTGALNVVEASASLRPAFPTTVTVRLESGGNPIAAPPGGTQVTLTAANPSCLLPQSPVTIGAGLVTVTVSLNYGGSAPLPCTTTLTASAPSLTSDAINVTVDPNPGITLFSLPTTVGASLQVGVFTARLGQSVAGGVTMRIESSDPTRVLVSPNTATVGAAFIDVVVSTGETDASYVVQALETAAGPAPVTITATAPGFTGATGTVTVVQPAVRIENLATGTTSLSTNEEFWVRVGTPNANNTNLVTTQNVRAGSSLTATVTNSAASVAQLVTAAGAAQARTVTIPAGQSFSPTSVAAGGVAFDPTGGGVTTVSAAIPGFISTTAASVAVTVTQPGISLFSLPATVGAGLQVGTFTARLGGSQHGGVTMRIESSDPARVLVAANATSVGSAFIDVPISNGLTDATYVVQALDAAAGPAPVTITASAPGFSDQTGSVTVAQPAVRIENLSTSTTSLSASQEFWVRVGLPNVTNSNLITTQNVRVGGSLTATVTNSAALVAQLMTTAGAAQSRTVTIPSGQSFSPTSMATGGVAFDPIGGGTTTVSAEIPGFITTAAGVVTVNVSTPGITLFSLPATVGAGLQVGSFTARLGGSQHGGVTMRISSSDPAVAKVAPNTTTPGTDFIDVPIGNNLTDATYVIEGQDGANGTVTITASAPGFSDQTGSATVVQPAVRIENLPTSTTSLSTSQDFWVRVGTPNANNTNLATTQNPRAGSSLTATVTNSAALVAQLVTTAGAAQARTVTIPAGQSFSPTSLATGGVAFDPIGGGTTTVSAEIPGFITTAAGVVTVNVSAPGISLFSLPATVGAGLQVGTFTARLGGSQHGGVTMRISSSNPAVAKVAPNTTTPGTDFIDVPVANNLTDATYVIEGQDGANGTVIITASAPGFTDQTGSATVVQPAVRIENLPTSTTSLSASQDFWVRVGTPNANNTNLATTQNPRAGSSLTATVTNSAALVAQLVTTAGAAQARTVTIPAGQSFSPTSVATGGVAFDPIGNGVTTVSATIPGFIATTAASVNVTVSTPTITLFSLPATVGAGLQTGLFTARLGASQHGGVTLRIQSANPGAVLISTSTTTVGSEFIDVNIANGQTDATYVIQVLETATTPSTVAVTATAAGFTGATGDVNIVRAAVRIESLPSSIAATSNSVDFFARVGIPNVGDANLSQLQNVRAGASVVVTLTNSNASAAQLVTSAGGAQVRTVTIPANQAFSPTTVATGGVAFDPLQAGNTSVTASIPGFITTTAGVVLVTVTP
jgi:uncharacterized repeat protein (TIGR01451 family)